MLLAFVGLVGCERHDYYPQAVAPVAVVPTAPVIVQQQSHVGDFATGMLAGHLLSGGFGSRQNTTIVHHYNAPRPIYRSNRSFFGGSSVTRSFRRR